MARRHAHLLTSIWTDPDWLQLSQNAQHVYMLLLSQPKLTRIGLLDMLPSRWARLAADTTPDSIRAGIDELETSRFVIVDHDTDELLIRSLVKHDATPDKTANQRWVAGVWSTWSAIESRQLRNDILHEIPASCWAHPQVKPPAEASDLPDGNFRQNTAPAGPPPAEAQNPRSARNVPAETPGRNSRQDVLQSPVSSLQSADSKQPSEEPPGARDPAAAAVENPTGEVLNQAIALLIDRELQRNPTRGPSIERHRAGIRKGKLADHQHRANELLTQQPHLDPDELANLLEPTPDHPSQPPAPDRRHIRDEPATRAHIDRIHNTPAPDPDQVNTALAAARNAITHPQEPK